MTSYGSNSATQLMAFGAADSAQDTRTGTARDIATSFINSKLNRTIDFSSPSDTVTRCANLLAAGLILTGQFTVDSANPHPFIRLAMELLDDLIGEDSTNSPWRINIPVDRF